MTALDFSPAGDLALTVALHAQVRAPDVTLHVVSVDPDLKFPKKFKHADEVQEFMRAEKRLALTMQYHVIAKLDEFERANGVRPTAVALHPRFGDPAEEILDAAAALDVDVLFVGTKGLSSVERLLLGSVAEQVVRSAGCPVQVVRPKAHPDVQDPVQQIEEPPEEGETLPSLDRPHRYHYVPRNVRAKPNYPLLYQSPQF
jgi:nucleotide-binding universal stress UspA family protein